MPHHRARAGWVGGVWRPLVPACLPLSGPRASKSQTRQASALIEVTFIPPLSTRSEQEFILQALQASDCRADGRTCRDARPLRVQYARGEAQASAEVQLGKTR